MKLLRFAWSRDLFEYIVPKFLEHWESLGSEDQSVKAFISYFREEWLGAKCNWYRGAAPGTVTHNQSIETEQGLLKKTMSAGLFKKMHLLQFLGNAVEYVETISAKRQESIHIESPIKFETVPEYNRQVRGLIVIRQ